MPSSLPGRKAATKIVLDPTSGLVTVLCRLREQLHDDCRDRARNVLQPLHRGHRLSGNVAVHPFHRVGRRKGQTPREHLVQGDTQSVEIAARVDRAIHPAGLFRRHVGQRAGDEFRQLEGLALAPKPRRDAEAHEANATRSRIHQDVGRLNVLVNQIAGVKLAQGARQADGQMQKLSHLHRPTDESVQRLAAGIVQDEHRPPVVLNKREGPDRPFRVEVLPQGEFVLQSLSALS